MSTSTTTTPPRVWVGMALMSLGVLCLASTHVYAPDRSWILANGAVAGVLLAGGMVIGNWGERPAPGFAKRAILVMTVGLAAVAAMWAILQGYI